MFCVYRKGAGKDGEACVTPAWSRGLLQPAHAFAVLDNSPISIQIIKPPYSLPT